ncbi:uncharacterized protein DUF998 [Prauserella shujinwangii]|uniref:Uncharacterized protein DUF998 n=1 Tax=Prauserella shujinwangii TaxID=1453103 RepID=A0A2T0LR75_9PSEU|nr:DUF998 domain-containing protein [Prauserella shujinwangii]PRX45974.1 uncharacterized protein DUF998 [Prauserella shujinwangii]
MPGGERMGETNRVNAFAVAGLAGLACGAVLMALLHVLPYAHGVDPVRRTISEYALGPGKWLFDVAVLLVALGSAAVFGGLVRHGVVRARSAVTGFGALWTAGLLTIVAFEKTDWSVGPSLGGTIHRYASVVAFVCLPLAVLLAARAVHPHSPVRRRLTRALAVTSLLWFGVILGAVAVMLAGGPPWWRAIPLGLVERALALNEVLAITALALGTLRGRTGMMDVTARRGRLRVPC